MKAVPTYGIFLFKLQRQGVAVGVCGHALVKGSIKYRNLRNGWVVCCKGTDCFKIGGVVQRCKRDNTFNRCNNFRGDFYRLAEMFSSMYHAVSDSIERAEIFENMLRLEKLCKQ